MGAIIRATMRAITLTAAALAAGALILPASVGAKVIGIIYPDCCIAYVNAAKVLKAELAKGGYGPGQAEIHEQKPSEAMDFRVYARLDTFYAYEFADRERYQALLLTGRNSEEFLFGYIEKGSADEIELTRFLSREITKGQPVLLRLRFLPETRSRRSVLVEKVVAPRWVHVEPPEEDE